MNRAYRLFVSYLLLATFLFATAPVELVHELTHHHDSIESHDGATAVGVQHVHCDLLQLSLPAFSETQILVVNGTPVASVICLTLPTSRPVSFAFLLSPPGRAPPALV